jgi:hypothetical protein
MPANRSQPMEPTEELARIGALLLRRQIGTQSDTILELSRVGFGPSRIAELLGTTPNTVNQAIQKNARRTTRASEKKGTGS